MKITKFEIEGPILIEPKAFHDDRGFFTERFRVDTFREIGIPNSFIQDNFSISQPGVLRGLHYQYAPPQGKLVTCTSGRIFDVAVDIRSGSPTFGQWVSAELSGEKPSWLWVPAGFAHGFCVIGNQPAGVLYKVDCGWAVGGEGGIRWDDQDLKITWPETNVILSGKDLELPTFTQYTKAPRFQWK